MENSINNECENNNKNESKITKMKYWTINFLKKNKSKIFIASEIGLSVIVVALVVDDINQRNNVKKLTEKIFTQKSKIKYLYEQNSTKTRRIETLENFCMKKDNFFKKFISDGTKRGDSECARQLAYRKQYIKGII